MDLEMTREDRPDTLGTAVIAAMGAALSLAISGHVYGISTNLYHLPIIGRLFDEPQFRTDAYMQSLRFYAAGPFLLLRGADRIIDPARLFFILSYFARVLSFVGFLACARLLGVATRRDRSLFALLIATSSIMDGGSFAGGGDLFSMHFTHSEIASGLSLIAIAYAARGRLTEAFAANGLTFFTNAFMAIWNAAPLGFIICLLLAKRQITPRQVVLRCSIGLLLFLVIASPVVINVLENPDYGKPIAFDYLDYLKQFWPYHFLFNSSSLGAKAALVVVLLTGTLAFIVLAGQADVFQVALWGYVVVYAIGIVLPSLTSSAAMLNLHLLRSGFGIHMLAALGSAALATRWLTSCDPLRARGLAPLLVLTLCTARAALSLAPVIIGAALTRLPGRRVPVAVLQGRPILLGGAIVILLAFWTYAVGKTAREHAVIVANRSRWAAVAEWAHVNTPADAVFLVPVVVTRKDADENVGSEIFDYLSHRRVWVESGWGAAVMWSQSYYPIWHGRVTEVLQLSSLPERLTYAKGHGISYVIDECDPSNDGRAVFRAARLCVFETDRD